MFVPLDLRSTLSQVADDFQKFQDLEEERLDFMKSSLWTFANVASTVCVSDDAVGLFSCKLPLELIFAVL